MKYAWQNFSRYIKSKCLHDGFDMGLYVGIVYVNDINLINAWKFIKATSMQNCICVHKLLLFIF